MIRVSIIGSGNVAQHLSKAVRRSPDLQLVEICARNRTVGEKLSRVCECRFTDLVSEMQEADLYVLAVSDDAVAKLSGEIKVTGAVVAHVAGSVDMADLSPKITNRAVLYPLMTFTAGCEVEFSQVPLLIEGSNIVSLSCVRAVATALSSNVLEVDSARRSKMHLAAVFACNFANHMYVIGEKLLLQAGVTFDTLKPLIAQASKKALESNSPREIQTGPAIRNDFKTKAKHCEMLAQQPEIQTLYINLSNSIWETSKKTSQK